MEKIKLNEVEEVRKNISKYSLKFAPPRILIKVNEPDRINPAYLDWLVRVNKEIKEYGALCRKYGKQSSQNHGGKS